MHKIYPSSQQAIEEYREKILEQVAPEHRERIRVELARPRQPARKKVEKKALKLVPQKEKAS